MWTLETVSVILPELFPIVGAVFAAIFMAMLVVILYKAMRHADFTNLIMSQDEDGGVSLTKFWQNVAYAAATFAFLASSVSKNLSGGANEMIWMIYLGTVASSAVMSKWVSMRYSQPANQQRDRDYYGDYNTFPPGRGRPSPGGGYPRPGPSMPSGPPRAPQTGGRGSQIADPDD